MVAADVIVTPHASAISAGQVRQAEMFLANLAPVSHRAMRWRGWWSRWIRWVGDPPRLRGIQWEPSRAGIPPAARRTPRPSARPSRRRRGAHKLPRDLARRRHLDRAAGGGDGDQGVPPAAARRSRSSRCRSACGSGVGRRVLAPGSPASDSSSAREPCARVWLSNSSKTPARAAGRGAGLVLHQEVAAVQARHRRQRSEVHRHGREVCRLDTSTLPSRSHGGYGSCAGSPGASWCWRSPSSKLRRFPAGSRAMLGPEQCLEQRQPAGARLRRARARRRSIDSSPGPRGTASGSARPARRCGRPRRVNGVVRPFACAHSRLGVAVSATIPMPSKQVAIRVHVDPSEVRHRACGSGGMSRNTRSARGSASGAARGRRR